MPFKRATLSAVIAALPLSAVAADEVFVMQEVVVKGVKGSAQPMPLNESEVEAATMQSLRPATSDTASLLRDVPGVSLYGAGGISSLPSIHGLSDDRLRIKVDGMDLISACPNHMNPALSYIDPSRVDKIDVFAGITPVSVGGDSIGGSIVVDSAKPQFAKSGAGLLTRGEIGAFYRSNGNAMGANVSATAASETASVNYTGSTAQSENYKAGDNFKTTTATGRVGHTLPLDEVGSTAYKAINHALDFALRSDDHLIDLKLAHQKIPYENFPNQRMDMTDNESNQVNLGYTGQYHWGSLMARVYHEETSHEMDFGDDKRFWYGSNSGAGEPCSPIRFHGDPAGTCAAGMPMYTEGKTTGAALKVDIPLSGQDMLRVGTEFQRYRLDDWWKASGGAMGPGTFWNINDGERDRYALFAELERKNDPQWTTLLGLRHETIKMDAGDVRGYNPLTNGSGMMMNYQMRDGNAFNALDHEKTDHNWDLTALARYTPDATQSYEIGLAQKTRSPNLYERYTWSTWTMAAVMNNFIGDGNGYVGDINLKPEVARTLSISADWHDARKKWGIKATPYYTRVKDYIDAVQWDPATNLPDATPTVNGFSVLKYANQSARLYGLDISGFAQIANNTGLGDFALSGVINYVDGKNLDTDDNLYNIMPLNAKLALKQKLGRWSNTLEAQFVSAKDDVSQVRNEIETDGYSLFNLRSSYEWKQVRLDIGIENLFDKFYSLPLGGAYLGQGTTMSISGIPWGIAVPGPGRSLYAGVNVKF